MFAARGCTGWGSIVSAPNVSIVDVIFVITICNNNEVAHDNISRRGDCMCNMAPQEAAGYCSVGVEDRGAILPAYPLAVLEPGLWSGKEAAADWKVAMAR